MAASITLYTDSLNYINAVCESYVGENVAAVARLVGPFAFTMLTLYVVLWGFASYRGMIKEPANEFINRVITVCIVFGIGFNLATYNVLITNTFLRGPDEFVAGLAGSGSTGNVVSGLDAMLAQGFELGARFWAKAGVLDGDFGMYFVSAAVWAMTIIVTAYGFFLMALSKVALTVLIGLGALFFPWPPFPSNRWLLQFMDTATGQLLPRARAGGHGEPARHEAVLACRQRGDRYGIDDRGGPGVPVLRDGTRIPAGTRVGAVDGRRTCGRDVAVFVRDGTPDLGPPPAVRPQARQERGPAGNQCRPDPGQRREEGHSRRVELVPRPQAQHHPAHQAEVRNQAADL